MSSCATKPSPLPWHVGPEVKTDVVAFNGRLVCDCGPFTAQALADAEYIVAAANALAERVLNGRG